jgi:recombination protein RecA
LSNIDEILARLNPKTAQSFRKASEIEHELLPTPSLGINMAIQGLGYGRFTTLYGNRGCGKTMFALQCIAEAQKNGKTAAWLDVEKNFNPSWARRLGVNPDEMLVDNKTISIAGMADKGVEMIQAGVDVLVIDSISQLLPQSFFEDPKDGKEELKGLKDTGQIGTFSKNIGQAINMLNSVNENTAIILISQVRNQIGSYGASIGFMGGKALEHANSTTLKFWRTPSDVIERDVHVGDGLLLKRPVGAKVTWTVEKNRGPGMGMSNDYDIYTGGDFVGIDLASEVVTFGVEYGIIKKGGSWYTIGEQKFQGDKNAANHLRENPDILEKIYGEILAKSI